jgi:putative endonuclease
LKQDSTQHDQPVTPIWHLYMIRVENGHLYTGITTDVERRFSEHQSGRGAKYLRGKGLLTLVFHQEIGSRSAALKLEAQIKKMSKQQKESLLLGDMNLTSD